MSDYTLQILTTNYSGQIADIVFSPCSGGTINLGSQTLPYNYVSEYIYGDYELTFSGYGGSVCYLNIPCPSPTPTPTVTTTQTPTPTVTPTLTPTPSPVWLLVIENSNSTRSITNIDINGINQPLTIGSYPIVNSNSYAATHGTATGSNPDVLQFTFGGSGFFNTFQVFKNGVLQFDLPGYASGSMVCGGMSIASNDVIKAVFS